MKILLASFIVTVIISILTIPILKKLKVGQIEREDGPKSHLKKQGTPTMGGVTIIIAIVIMTIISCIYYASGKENLIKNIIPLTLVTVGFGIVGFVDDFKKLVLKNTKGLKPAYKMLGLLIISVGYVVFLIKGINIGTRNLYTNFKNIHRFTIMVLYTSSNICDARYDKCN